MLLCSVSFYFSSSSYTYLSCTSHHASIWLSFHFISSPTAIVQLSIVLFILANKQKCIHAAWKVDDERRKNLASTLPCMLFVCAVCFTMGHVINIKDYQQQTRGHDDEGKYKKRESNVRIFYIYSTMLFLSHSMFVWYKMWYWSLVSSRRRNNWQRFNVYDYSIIYKCISSSSFLPTIVSERGQWKYPRCYSAFRK